MSKQTGFFVGLLLGWMGGCFGVIVAGFLGEDALKGAAVGFGISILTALLFGAFWSSLFAGIAVDAPSSGPPVPAPVGPGGLPKVNLDGSPVQNEVMAGGGLPLLIAGIAGFGVAAMGAVGAAVMFLRGDEPEPREVRSVY